MGEHPPTSTRITRGQWLTLAAALLGWAFDGFEMGVFPLVARPALKELLGTAVPEEAVRQWNAVLAAAFLIGAAANFGYTVVAALALIITPEGHWRWLLVVCAGPALLTFFLRLFVPESEAWRVAAASGPKAGAAAVFAPGLRRHAAAGAAA